MALARIDLKNARVRLVDGYRAAGITVDNVAGYAAGAVTMTIDGAPVAAIPLLTAFTIPGSLRVHIITAVTGGPPTTSITFTPALTAAVDDGDALTILGRALEMKMGSGNLTYTKNRQFEAELDRGELDAMRQGNKMPMDVAFDGVWEEITAAPGATTPTFEDALDRVGPAAAWISSDLDTPCAPYCLDVQVENIPLCDGVAPEIITLPKFYYEQQDHDAQEATISTSGRCLATKPNVSRLE